MIGGLLRTWIAPETSCLLLLVDLYLIGLNLGNSHLVILSLLSFVLFSLVNAVKFNEYSSVVVSTSYNQSLRAWDCSLTALSQFRVLPDLQIIDSFSDSVMSVCLTNSEIIGGSVDGTVRTFDIRIGREISDDLGQPVNCISKSNDGNCILASCLDSTLHLLDRTSGELLQEYEGHTCKVTSVSYHPKDSCMITASVDGTISVWKT
ncbi:hypothetical protein SO802_026207 [Lithocarpus litseifolius]|uniref:Uncharacterized protein n=1 Tax=Lithocarpus litseifolius TaxID=425828 RepID=A0AAW2C0T4_9ROSI